MENTNKYQIIAPALTPTEYGKNVKEVFENINNNFTKLSNADFVKGAPGENVSLEEINFPNASIDGERFSNKSNVGFLFIYNGLLNEISNSLPDEQQTNINEPPTINDYNPHWMGVSHLSCEENNGSMIIYSESDDNGYYFNPKKSPSSLPESIYLYKKGDKYVGGIPFVYLDPRFSTEALKNVNMGDYENVQDLSCVLVPEFEITENNSDYTPDGTNYYKISFKVVKSFPTLYYDENVGGFCWLVNGQKTGLIANGPAGKDGKNGDVCVVKRNESGSEGGIYQITHILNSKNVNSGVFDEIGTDIEQYENKIAIVFPSKVEKDGSEQDKSNNVYWISTLEIDDTGSDGKKLVAICIDDNKIDSSFSDEALFQSFTRIEQNKQNEENGNGKLKGLFVPLANYNYSQDNGKNPSGYLMYASKDGDENGSLNIKALMNVNDPSGDTVEDIPSDENGHDKTYNNINIYPRTHFKSTARFAGIYNGGYLYNAGNMLCDGAESNISKLYVSNEDMKWGCKLSNIEKLHCAEIDNPPAYDINILQKVNINNGLSLIYWDSDKEVNHNSNLSISSQNDDATKTILNIFGGNDKSEIDGNPGVIIFDKAVTDSVTYTYVSYGNTKATVDMGTANCEVKVNITINGGFFQNEPEISEGRNNVFLNFFKAKNEINYSYINSDDNYDYFKTDNNGGRVGYTIELSYSLGEMEEKKYDIDIKIYCNSDTPIYEIEQDGNKLPNEFKTHIYKNDQYLPHFNELIQYKWGDNTWEGVNGSDIKIDNYLADIDKEKQVYVKCTQSGDKFRLESNVEVEENNYTNYTNIEANVSAYAIYKDGSIIKTKREEPSGEIYKRIISTNGWQIGMPSSYTKFITKINGDLEVAGGVKMGEVSITVVDSDTMKTMVIDGDLVIEGSVVANGYEQSKSSQSLRSLQTTSLCDYEIGLDEFTMNLAYLIDKFVEEGKIDYINSTYSEPLSNGFISINMNEGVIKVSGMLSSPYVTGPIAIGMEGNYEVDETITLINPTNPKTSLKNLLTNEYISITDYLV